LVNNRQYLIEDCHGSQSSPRNDRLKFEIASSFHSSQWLAGRKIKWI